MLWIHRHGYHIVSRKHPVLKTIPRFIPKHGPGFYFYWGCPFSFSPFDFVSLFLFCLFYSIFLRDFITQGRKQQWALENTQSKLKLGLLPSTQLVINLVHDQNLSPETTVTSMGSNILIVPGGNRVPRFIGGIVGFWVAQVKLLFSFEWKRNTRLWSCTSLA